MWLALGASFIVTIFANSAAIPVESNSKQPRNLYAYERSQIADFDLNTVLFDETLFANKKSFDYDFDDDLKKIASTDDAYDELVPYLPKFEVVKNGKKIGVTKLPIVTRPVQTWSTPLPRTKKNSYITFTTPRIDPVTFPTLYTTTPTAFRRQNNDNRREAISVPLLENAIPITDTSNNNLEFAVISRNNQPRTNGIFNNPNRPRLEAIKIVTPIAATGQRSNSGINVQVSTVIDNSNPVLVSRLDGSEIPMRAHVNVKSNRLRLSDTTTTSRPTTTRRPPITTTTRKTTTLSTPAARPPSGYRHRSFPVKLPDSSPRLRQLVVPKPPLIDYADRPYKGPTYGCRVLNPESDGRPSRENSPDCRLRSANKTCACIYEIDKRDENGCVTGFVYTCTKND